MSLDSNYIKLNCDMGESFGIYQMGFDELIMPYIDMANLACGFHASDPVTMHKSIKLAKKHSVEIGAHPSYPDLVGFGRREMRCTTEEIVSFILYQLGALDALCRSYGVEVSYTKPHGALYNSMMRDIEVFRAIAKAISKYNKSIKLMILSSNQNEYYAKVANRYGVTLLYEIFADRGYDSSGLLVPRDKKGAVLTHSEVLKRGELLFSKGIIETIDKKELKLKADSLCVHGDNKEALEMIKALFEMRRELSYES